MTDETNDYEIENLGDLILEGLEEARAWQRGEIALPVYNIPNEYPQRIRALRKKLGYRSRQAFEEAFAIPAKTLQNWEQGRTTPDPTARAYLRVIEANPEGVKKALEGA